MTQLSNNRGFAILEIALVVVVLGALGFIGWRGYGQRHTTATTSTKTTAPVVPNGSVDNATNALIQDASDDTSIRDSEDGDTPLVTSDGSAADNLGDSYNDNSL